MLIDFTVENFRSFRGPKTLSMIASPARERSENTTAISSLDLRLIRSAAIYGPNASGKSNLLAAMNNLGNLIRFPTQGSAYGEIQPFLMDRHHREKAIRWKVRFLIEGTIFEYEIAIESTHIGNESLVAYPNGRRQEWFVRNKQEFKFNSTHLKGPKESLKELTRLNLSLLGIASQIEHPQLGRPGGWLLQNLRFLVGDRTVQSSHFMSRLNSRASRTDKLLLNDKSFADWANGLMRHADLGIQKVELVRVGPSRPRDKKSRLEALPEEQGENQFHVPVFSHSGEEDDLIRFDARHESSGTLRWYDLLGYLYEVLRDGRLAIIDELERNLHPTLAREIVRLFHDPKTNPKGAQLIFATHDATLLSGQLFRRDQVWFTEKNRAGATDLYSLNDIKGVREDDTFEKGYLRGRYGAIPFFGPFDFPPIVEKAKAKTAET